MRRWHRLVLCVLLCGFLLAADLSAAEQRRLVLQPMSVPGYQPFTTESHEWYWSSYDGHRLAYLSRVIGGEAPVVDGIVYPTYSKVTSRLIWFGPADSHVIYTVERDGFERLVVDGVVGPPFTHVNLPVFSRDGAHMAYIAESAGRQFQVISDGQSGPAFTNIWRPQYCADGRLVYTAGRKENENFVIVDKLQLGPYPRVSSEPVCSPDGKHFTYWVGKGGDPTQYAIIADGREGPAYTGIICEPIFSPDSRRLAYVVYSKDLVHLILDGKEMVSFAGNAAVRDFFFSPDSAHLVSKIDLNRRDHLLLDGKEIAAAARVMDVQYCGNRLAYRLVEGNRERVVIGDTVYPWNTVTAVGTDIGGNYLWIACYLGRWWTFYDGTEGEPDNLFRGINCSLDGMHWAYPVNVGRQQALLADGRIGPKFRAVGVPFFSPDGNRLAYPVYDGSRFAMVVDGQRGARYRSVGSPAFSPDNRRVAHSAYTKNGATVVIDGQPGTTFSDILGKGYLWNGIQLTFDAPDRLHYLARSGQRLYYVREYLLPAPSSKTFTYFEDGYVTRPRKQVEQAERQAVEGGHMPWRSDVLSVARVMGMSLLPFIAPGKTPVIRELPRGAGHDLSVASGRWEAIFRQVSATQARAQVDVFVNGYHWYRLTLERPFGQWWYLTGIETTAK